MNYYKEKIREMYNRDGITSLFLASVKYTLYQTAILISNFANSIPISIINNKLLKENRRFKNIHKNKRCFIIGNGPSLKKHNLSLLKNEITFVVNAFWKHPIIKEWQPTYYCIADPVFFDGSGIMRNFFENLFLGVNNSKFFIPQYSRKLIKNNKLPFPKEKTNYIAFRDDLCRKTLTSIDITNYIPGVINVTELAMMIAIYMGCTPIYLIGFDHDWLSHRSKDRHFYKEETVSNHKKATGTFKNISYIVTIKDVLKLWQGYENLSKYSNKKGINILNASKGGFLDVFERVKYESIFSQNNNKEL